MSGSDRFDRTRLLPLTTVIIGVLLIAGVTAAATGGGIAVNWIEPEDGDNITGSQTFNISVDPSSNVRYVELYYNQSGPSWTLLHNITNTSVSQQYFNTTNETDFNDGDLDLNATAYNDTRAGWNNISVTVDNTPPDTVTALTPLDGENLSGMVYVNATATDATTAVASVEHRWQDSSGTNVTGWLANGTETNTSDLTGDTGDGSYTILYRANDSAGNTNSSYNISVTVDNTPPEITPINPAQGSDVVVEGTVDVTGDATDATTNVSWFRYWWYNGTNVTGWQDVNTTFDTSTLADGTGYTISFRANDSVGNRAWDNTTVVAIDNDLPEINITVPVANANLSGTVEVNATASDPGRGIDTLRYQWRNATDKAKSTWINITDTNDTFDTVANNLADGDYVLNFTANDTAGNITTVNHSVTVDNTPPNGTNDLNLSEENYSALRDWGPVDRMLNDTMVNLTWAGYNAANEIQDDGSGVKELQLHGITRAFNTSTGELNDWDPVRWNRVEIINRTKPGDKNYTLQGNSSLHGYQVRVNLSTVDWAGNHNASNIVNFSIDITPPVFATETDGSNVTDEWVGEPNAMVSAQITDFAGINNDSIEAWVNDSAVAAQNVTLVEDGENLSRYTVEVNGTQLLNLNEGTTYEVTVAASDTFGHRGNLSWDFRTDFTAPDAPSVTVHGDTVSGWYKREATVEIDCTDGGSGPAAVAVFEFDTGDQIGSWNSSLEGSAANITIAQHGNTTYQAACRDVAGNVNKENITVDGSDSLPIDRQEPEVTEDDSNSEWENTDRSFTKDISVSDDTGVKESDSHLQLDTDEGSLSIDSWNNDTISVDVSDLSYGGLYTIEGHLVDYAGNNNSGNFVDFDTEENSSSSSDEESTTTSGGGGGTLTDSMTFNDVPDLVSVVQGQETSVDLTLENDGDLSMDNVGFTVDVDTLTVDVSPAGFDLDSGDSEDLTASISAPSDADTGVYEATIEAQSDQDTTTSTSFDIEVTERAPEFTFTMDDEIDIYASNTTSVDVQVENTGTEDAGNVTFAVDADNITASLDSTSATLEQNEVTTLTLDLSAPADLPLGEYDGTVTAESGDTTGTAAFTAKLQPESESEAQRIEREFRELEDDLDALSENESSTEIEALRSEANEALEDGDYARAAELTRQIRERLDMDGGGGFPLLLVLGILLGAALLGGVLYLSLVEEEDAAERAAGSPLGPVRPSQGYDHQDGGGVVERLRHVWLWFSAHVLHHSRQAHQKAQTHLEEFRDRQEERRNERRRR